MAARTAEQVIENILKEAINFLKLRPDLFQEIGGTVASRLLDAAKVTKDEQLLLLYFSFRNFSIPLREYYDRLFRREIKEGGLRKRLQEKGLEEGEAIFAMTIVNELDIRKCIEVEGGIDEKSINEALSERLKILGSEERIRMVFWEIVKAIEEALSKIAGNGSQELIKIYEKLLEVVKTNGISGVKNEVEKLIVEFDNRIRKEFVVG